MLVEQPTSDQIMLQLAEFITDVPTFSRILKRLLKLALGISSVPQVGLRDSSASFLGPWTCARTTMHPATAILFVGRTLALSSFSGLGTASLPRPIRPETPFNTDVHIVFYRHENTPDHEVS